MATRTIESVNAHIAEVHSGMTTKAMVKLHNELVVKPIGVKPKAMTKTLTLAALEQELVILNLPANTIENAVNKALKADVIVNEIKRPKGTLVSFDGSKFCGITGTKIALWKDAIAIRLIGKFSADQLKYYGQRFDAKITYVTTDEA